MSELDEHVEKENVEEYKIPEYFFKPERQEEESVEDYRKRRLLEKFMLKEIKKGTVVWKSLYSVDNKKYVGITYNKRVVAQYVKNKLKEENGNNQESEGAE
jgi:hypothetical protein